MIDTNLLFWLEVFALTVLIGVGIWHAYRTRQSAASKASAPMAYDMRENGQRLSVQTSPR
jgi:ABC-type nickel/cobalt efflux system permease component RcnA